MNRDVSSIFNKFAGREVSVTENPRQAYGHTYLCPSIDQGDAVIKEINEEAEKHGLFTRVWLPQSAGTDDIRMNRLNVHIEKEADGKYRIQKGFRLG